MITVMSSVTVRHHSAEIRSRQMGSVSHPKEFRPETGDQTQDQEENKAAMWSTQGTSSVWGYRRGLDDWENKPWRSLCAYMDWRCGWYQEWQCPGLLRMVSCGAKREVRRRSESCQTSDIRNGTRSSVESHEVIDGFHQTPMKRKANLGIYFINYLASIQTLRKAT